MHDGILIDDSLINRTYDLHQTFLTIKLEARRLALFC